MYAMAGRPGGSSAPSATVLKYSSADAVTGSATIADNGDNLDITVPAGSAMTNLSTAPDLLVWDTGLTVADLRGRSIGLRVSSLTAPSGTGAQIALCYGFAFAATTALDRSTDTTAWLNHSIGRSTDANTRSRFVARSNNAVIANGSTLDNLSEARMLLFPATNDQVGSWLARADPTSGTYRELTGSNLTSLTSTDKALAFLAVGLSGTEASAQDISFKFEYLPPGADWGAS